MAFQGSLRELPLPDIIQLVSVSGKTGMFALENGSFNGEIYLHEGQIADANVGDLQGEEAVYEMAIWREGNFVFTPGQEARQETIRKSNTNLLMEAARRIDEWQVLSKKIPSTRLVPVFTDQTATTSVSLTPLEWQLISKIDERRTIEEIAVAIQKSAFETCKLLYGLIASSLVALKESLSYLRTDRLKSMTPEELAEAAGKIHELSSRMLAGHKEKEELEATIRLSKAELAGGRRMDAPLDLVRANDKLISSALGPNHSKSFLDRVERIFKSG